MIQVELSFWRPENIIETLRYLPVITQYYTTGGQEIKRNNSQIIQIYHTENWQTQKFL